MISLRTGLPGSGKTLRTVVMASSEARAGREVYALNVTGLDYDATGIKPWPKGLEDWRELPQGAVLIVDEVQQWLKPRGPQATVPEWIEEFTRHRHRGIDLHFVTQDPKLIDAYVRRLVTYHEHLVRVEGGYNKARVYYSDQGVMETRKDMKLAEYQLWSYPKEAFDLYKSSVQHTGKTRIPQFAKVGVLAALAIVAAVLVFMKVMFPADEAPPPAPVAQVKPATPAPNLFGGFQLPQARPQQAMTTAEYLQQLVPRVEGMPWSAPLYDSFKPNLPPRIFCMAGGRSECGCYTEQATRVKVDYAICMAIVEDGLYDPFLTVRQGAI